MDNPSGNGGDLTLQAGRSITINQPIISDDGNVTLIANDLLANGVIDAQRLAGDANITFGTNGSINAGTGTVNLELRLGTGKTYSSYGDFVGMGTNFSKITAARTNISPYEVFTFTADNKTMTYGASMPGLTYSRTGRLFGTDSAAFTGSPTISTTASSIANVGAYAITIARGTLATLKNYYSFDFVPATFTITKAMLTVRADDKRRDYNVDNPSLTASITGFLNGDTAAVITGLSLSTSATRASTSGTYAINPFGASATNYDFTFLPGTLTVNAGIPTQTLVFKANNQAMTYGAAVPNLSAAYSFSGLYGSDTAAMAFSGAPVLSTVASSTSNVGAYEIAIARGTLAALTYYYDFSFVPGVLTITKAQLTVRADDKGREYGLANPALTASISGYRNGDTSSVVSGLSLATAATQGSNVGTYQITASGASATNYDFSYLPGTLTVTKARLTVQVDDKTREYG
ncbi:MAG: MBG domain-containing protein, partial [Caulobacteraceae bacterium]|nr:MBG domain-containing protein [Caulobacteraceae bacterium]